MVGLGDSGFSAAKFLAGKGAVVRLTESGSSGNIESRMKELEGLGILIETGGHTGAFCSEADVVVVSPGVDMRVLRSKSILPNNVPVIGEIELGVAFCRGKIVAVTGTNGKSTTVELIGHILRLSGRRAVVCGNIGTPFTSVVNDLEDADVAVVEVSSFQLETIMEFKPHIAALLNVSDDHFDRHGGYERYKLEKFRIFSNQDRSDYALIHSDLRGDAALDSLKGRIIFFDETDAVFDRRNTVLRGRHNLDNAKCASEVCRLLGISEDDIAAGIKTFKGLDCRYESIGNFGGVEYIDDSKATNIDATRRALESLTGKAVLIAGGRDKGGDYRSIRSVIREKVKMMVVIGESREKIKAAFSDIIRVVDALTMKEAVKIAVSAADPGDTVILSPMCSSFDMFKSYRERGEVFRKEVMQ